MSRLLQFFCLNIIPFLLADSSQIIDVFTLGDLADSSVAALRLAIKHINNNESDILPNYTMNLIELNTDGSTTVALKKVLEIKEDVEDSCPVANLSTTNNITMPIVLGCPYSSTSSITAPVLDTIDWAQIASTATSILLSDKSKYPTFYRTIADDSLQAAGIVGILEYFEWTEVAVVYVNDIYGAYLAIEIMNLASAKETDFEVTPIAFNDGDVDSIKSAIHQLGLSGVFITVLAVHGSDLGTIMEALQEEGLYGYPYYYIGGDSWIYDDVLGNDTNLLSGYIGTAPWGTHMLSMEHYNASSDLQEMYNASLAKLEYFQSFWETEFAKNSSWANGRATPDTYSYYGWDSAYAAALVAQYILEEHGTLENLSTTNISFIDEILTNHINFTGVTGSVSFADNGDRDKGLFAFGNVLENGSVSWIGYFSEYYEVTYVNFEDIVWPQDFREKGMTPRTSVLVRYELMTISTGLFITITILAAISILVAIALIVLTAIYSEDDIMRAASWRLNIAVCIGTVTAYTFVIISGLDEGMLTVSQLDGICAAKYWFLSIAFTLGAMPLFLKTYRVSVIFTESLTLKKVGDVQLMVKLQICVVVDLVLFTVYTILLSRGWYHENGSKETIDALQLKRCVGV